MYSTTKSSDFFTVGYDPHEVSTGISGIYMITGKHLASQKPITSIFIRKENREASVDKGLAIIDLMPLGTTTTVPHYVDGDDCAVFITITGNPDRVAELLRKRGQIDQDFAQAVRSAESDVRGKVGTDKDLIPGVKEY